MADLSFTQGADPVEITNGSSGNIMAVNADGSTNDNLAKVGGTAIALGQNTMAASIPVVVASDQSTITVSTDSKKATYSAAFVGLVPAAATTDLVTITGSGTKTVRIIRMVLSTSTTSGSGISVNVSVVKRSSANSGGTSSNAVAVPHDSNNAAATATVAGYTANPTTLGTAVGPIRAIRYSAITAGGNQNELTWEFGNRPSQAIVLRGTSQQLSINLNGASITGGIADLSVEWTEE